MKERKKTPSDMMEFPARLKWLVCPSVPGTGTGAAAVTAVPGLTHVNLPEPHSFDPTAALVSTCPWDQCPSSWNKVPGMVQGSYCRATGRRCPKFRGQEGLVWSETWSQFTLMLSSPAALTCRGHNLHCEGAQCPVLSHQDRLWPVRGEDCSPHRSAKASQ